MRRTRAEIGDIAKGMFAMLLADMQFEFPQVAKAFNKLAVKEWDEFCKEKISDIENVLLNKFDSID